MKTVNKRYYKIGEVSELLGLPLSTLRFWEKNFTVISPMRNAAGTRYYTAEDVEKIEMVAYLVKEKGLKLAAAEASLNANRSGVSRKFAAIKRLNEIKATLEDIEQALTERIRKTSGGV